MTDEPAVFIKLADGESVFVGVITPHDGGFTSYHGAWVSRDGDQIHVSAGEQIRSNEGVLDLGIIRASDDPVNPSEFVRAWEQIDKL